MFENKPPLFVGTNAQGRPASSCVRVKQDAKSSSDLEVESLSMGARALAVGPAKVSNRIDAIGKGAPVRMVISGLTLYE